jgi:hypothetical protein
VILDRLNTTAEDFERATGWAIKPQGACLGDMCVPLPEGVDGDRLDVAAVAARLGMPVVSGDGVHAVGPATVGGRALASAAAPDLTLPDLDGRPFSLSSLRGQKVLLVAWAPW